METRDLVDKNRILIGKTIEKGKKIPKGNYIQVAVIIIQNSKGEYLIQKRSIKKDGMWGVTGGHIRAGENCLDGIIRETKEEIGIEIPKEKIELISTRKLEYVFFDVYYSEIDINIDKLKLQKEEVEKVEWISLREIEKKYSEKNFLIGHMYSINQYIQVAKEQNAENKIDNRSEKRQSYTYIGKTINIKIDRKIGSKHPKYPDHIYLTNYGYVPNTISGDGEELDAYILGEYKPLKEFTGKCIAVIHRINDNDDKLIVVPEGKYYTDSEIRLLTDFQEKYFKSEIIR